ncbi:MAG TPA: DUF1576 domain-containing protein [Chitinophagales bacterium]|nr:DUF1576 domain-containing protein [Chitinophagales bacterium]
MKIRNWTLLITLSALASIFYFYFTPSYLHPAEDASILFNYARNLKDTGVISYYPGGPAVDGSTDFLFLLLISGVLNLVSDAYTAALLISGVSTMLMIFFIFRLLDTKSLSLQYLALVLIFFSQQIWAAVLGYGTFLFAMVISWAILAFWKGSLKTLAIVSFIAVLCRPDALITVLPLLMYLLYKKRERLPKNIGIVLLNFILPVIGYGIFRWWYFGSVLPLSFDINTAGNDKIWNLFFINSIHHVKGYALYNIYPGLIGLFIYFAKSKFKIKSEYYVLIFSTVIFPMLAYLTIRENLDFAYRYMMIPYLGIVITMCLLIRNYKSIIISIFGLFLLLQIGYTSVNQGSKSLNHYYNNIYDLSEELSQYPDLKLATSEAGIITWKSKLKTMDMWGLNTPSMTNHLITKEDLHEWNPDIIYIHPFKVDDIYFNEDYISNKKSWISMTQNVTNTLYEDKYLTYLVPYDTRAYKEVELTNVGLFKSVLKFISENKKSTTPPVYRQELFGIHPKAKNKAELIQIIEKYGGKQFTIPPKDYE